MYALEFSHCCSAAAIPKMRSTTSCSYARPRNTESIPFRPPILAITIPRRTRRSAISRYSAFNWRSVFPSSAGSDRPAFSAFQISRNSSSISQFGGENLQASSSKSSSRRLGSSAVAAANPIRRSWSFVGHGTSSILRCRRQNRKMPRAIRRDHRSTHTAMPMPPPMQSVAKPLLLPRRWSS